MANNRKRIVASTPVRSRRIVFVVVPPIEELDLVGPMQVFGAADRLYGRKIYSLEIATNRKELEVQGEGGMLSFLAQCRLKDVKGTIDSVLLVSSVSTRLARDPALSQWLRKIAPAIHRLGGVCVSAFLLAEAGVLNGRRATAHWKFGENLPNGILKCKWSPSRSGLEMGTFIPRRVSPPELISRSLGLTKIAAAPSRTRLLANLSCFLDGLPVSS